MEMASPAMDISDGTNDVSHTAHNMLLLRKLDSLSSEESIFNAAKIFPGLRRVLLIKDKLTKMSCEFAFLDFFNVQAAAAALQAISSGSFKVDGRTPAASYASPDSFLPAYAASEWTVQADVPEGLWMYRDDQGFASEYSSRQEQERAQKEMEEKRLAAERKAKQEESKKAKENDSLEDDLSAFYAGMGSILSNDQSEAAEIFSVPKI
ncbi:hypothetical protein BX666DRAFT_1473997 [Dichotomocladium elegans]|nr:hypothetical protein BX666DRAFT_1473997 [Dichotomocladium elegans]